MNKENNIQDLIRKFKEKKLTAEETKELYSLIQREDNDSDLYNVIKKKWNDTDYENIEVPTSRMLEKIKQQSNLKQKDNHRIHLSISKKILPYLKYAAIIIFSLGLGWLIRGSYTLEKQYDNGNFHMLSNNEVTVSYGSKTKVKLPDGSVVNLNSGSILRYPAKFDSISRNVYLEGEAFFDVKKDSAHPFLVKTKDITIRVLGTEFNVKAYNEEQTVQTLLVSGSIEIYSSNKEIISKNRLLKLKPYQKATFQRENKTIAVADIKKVSTTLKPTPELATSSKNDAAINTFISWKDNLLVFRDERFSDIAKKMERWYDVEIEIIDEELANVLLSGIFEKESVEQALNALRIATPFQYQMKKNVIVITKMNY